MVTRIVKKINLKLFAIGLFTSFVCTGALLEASTSYTYESAVNCQDTGDGPKIKWSALGGYQVGPKQALQQLRLSDKILRPFISDGCSASPDGIPGAQQGQNWLDCCVQHDVSYWLGGTLLEKQNADEKLRQCIASKGFPEVAKIYKLFVGQFGGPGTYQSYRWGFGWNQQISYEPLGVSDLNQVESLYGKPFSEVHRDLEQTHNIKLQCDSTDFAFIDWTEDDPVIYTYLNQHLYQTDRVSWVQMSYFNLDRREY